MSPLDRSGGLPKGGRFRKVQGKVVSENDHRSHLCPDREKRPERLSYLIKVTQPGKWQRAGDSTVASDLTPVKSWCKKIA